jgi:hypothetical protein
VYHQGELLGAVSLTNPPEIASRPPRSTSRGTWRRAQGSCFETCA